MKDATEIVVVLDKSGSMVGRAADAIGGFNAFLQDQQKQPGEANLTLVMFDTTYIVVHSGKPIKAVEPLSTSTYMPGGNTALLDALARAVIETGKRLSDIPEKDRPSKVICVTITDGEENSSKEHTRAQVHDMVKHQEEKYGWAFMYLGANVDTFTEASNLGIAGARAMTFVCSASGVKGAYQGTSDAVSSYRIGGSAQLDADENKWKDVVRAGNKDKSS